MRVLVCVVFATWLVAGSAWLLSQGDGAGLKQLWPETSAEAVGAKAPGS